MSVPRSMGLIPYRAAARLIRRRRSPPNAFLFRSFNPSMLLNPLFFAVSGGIVSGSTTNPGVGLFKDVSARRLTE